MTYGLQCAFKDFTVPPQVPPTGGANGGNGGNGQGGNNGNVPPTGGNGNNNGGPGGIGNIGNSTPVMTGPQGEDFIKERCINYNEKFKGATEALFRDEVIDQAWGILLGKNKPNVLLVGPAGGGKTRIVEEMARRLANDDASVPDALKGYTIIELPLSALVSGASLVGELEENARTFIDYVSDKSNKTIAFLDEVHQLSGHNEIYGKIAQILKPAMARGDMKVIASTTTQEVQNLMSDPAFNRRFSRVIVDELTREQTVEILKAGIPSLVNHYQNKICLDEDLMGTVAAIADKFHASGNHRPDTAITLLDRTCGEVVVYQKKREVEIANIADDDLRKQAQAALATMKSTLVSEEALRKCAMNIMTGNAESKQVTGKALDEAFSHIFGQEKALAKIRHALLRDAAGIFPREKPLSMLLCGDSGVGKTEVARKTSEAVCGTDIIYLNMTEYDSDASIARIIGAPAGYVGYDSHDELPFDKLDSNPYQVIVLDEFEKGARGVQRLFMSALENGYIETSRGKTIDFSKTIIIATTNAGHTNSKKHSMGFGENEYENESTGLTESLKGFFDIELLNRFSLICEFAQIDKETYTNIVRDVWESEVCLAKSEGKWDFLPDTIEDDVLERIVKETYNKELGARPAGRAVRAEIEEACMATL